MNLSRNTSLPTLSPTFVKRPYRSPPKHPHLLFPSSPQPHFQPSPHNLLDIEQIQQQQYYIQKLRQQRQRMQLFKQEFERKDRKIKDLEDELDRVKSKDSDAYVKYQQRITLLETETQNLSKQNQSLTLSLRLHKSQLFSVTQELQDLSSHSESLASTLESLRQQLYQAHNTSQELQEHIECIHSQHEWEIRELEKEMEGWKGRWQGERKQGQEMKKEMEGMRRENGDLEVGLEKRRIDMQGLWRQNERLKQELNQGRVELQRVMGRIQTWQSTKELKQTQYISGLNEGLRKSNQKIQKLKKSNKEYKKRILEHEQCVVGYMEEIKELKGKNWSLDEEYRKQQEILLNYTVLERKYLEENDRLKKEVREKEKGNKGEGEGKLKVELERLRHELYVLRSAEVEKMDKVFKSFEREKKRH